MRRQTRSARRQIGVVLIIRQSIFDRFRLGQRRNVGGSGAADYGQGQHGIRNTSRMHGHLVVLRRSVFIRVFSGRRISRVSLREQTRNSRVLRKNRAEEFSK